jgi:hypothetical protein
MKKIFSLCALCLLCISPWAADFGLVLDMTPAGVGAGGGGDAGGGARGEFDFTGLFIPRFSVPVGDGEIFVSAAVRADYENEGWDAVPELLRTEFSTRFNNLELKIGRTQYADPLGFIANGLFDGALFSYGTDRVGTFSLGALYAGLVSKKRANITMTGKELKSYNDKTDYSDFAGTYFAPRRFIASMGWEHPGLGELVRAKAAFISQSDLSGGGLHSQYIAAKFTVPVSFFVFDLGGCLELIEGAPSNGTPSNGGETEIGLAGEFGVSCNPGIEDRLSFTGRFSSGTSGDGGITAFLPVTTVSQGEAFEAGLSGLSALSLEYLARLHKSFSASLSSVYFIRSDLAVYANYGDKGYFLGDEIFGRLIWSPVSDIQTKLGGGVFLPSLGNASRKPGPLWRVELNIVLALY